MFILNYLDIVVDFFSSIPFTNCSHSTTRTQTDKQIIVHVYGLSIWMEFYRTMCITLPFTHTHTNNDT